MRKDENGKEVIMIRLGREGDGVGFSVLRQIIMNLSEMQVMGEVCAKFQRLFLFCIALIVSFLIIFCSTEKKKSVHRKKTEQVVI